MVSPHASLGLAAPGPSPRAPRGGRFLWVVLLAVVSLLGNSGCASVGLTLFGVGSGVSGGTGVSHILDSVAYKTFTTPIESLQDATLVTLEGMDIEVTDIEVLEEEATETGRKIMALAGDRTIEIELDRLTPKASRMRVNAKRGLILRDRATAAEIITQTERTLDKERPPSATAK